MDALAVSAQGLSKTYRVYATPLDRAREALTRRPRHREFHALRDVSFDLRAGEGCGIIGENGAGKSTLLKILAGVTTPTAGRFAVGGKVASILELGSGFHPEFTGRQNIVLNAAMLGLTECEVRERTPAIVEWSELGEFIDQPVKTYSTGMAMRLGFSIATQVDPDVLIVDEALSVGDGYFQKKCVDRLQAMLAAGKTLLFCSHAMYYVSAFCQRALWLRHGRVEALGEADSVVRAYENFLLQKSGIGATPPEAHAAPERRVARLLSIEQPGKPGSPPVYSCGERFCLEIEWESLDRTADFQIGVGFNRSDGIEVASFATHFSGHAPLSGEARYAVRLELPELPLLKGEFSLYVFLLDGAGLHIYDQRILPHALSVENPSYRFGMVAIPHRFTVVEPAAPPLAVVK